MKNKIVSAARQALAEACWKGYKARGMKKKGNRMVPNCVKESKLDDLPTKMRLAAQKARANGEDPVEAVERVRKRFEAEADKEHYEDKNTQNKGIGESEDSLPKKPRAGQKAREKRAGVTPEKPPAQRRDVVGQAGAQYLRIRQQPHHPEGQEKAIGPVAPTKQIPLAQVKATKSTSNRPDSPVNRGKKKRTKKTKALSIKQINRTGERGHEEKIEAKRKKRMPRKVGAANIQLMRDLGVLKTDSRGRVTLAKRKR